MFGSARPGGLGRAVGSSSHKGKNENMTNNATESQDDDDEENINMEVEDTIHEVIFTFDTF